ncbi:MAG: hypothetical protein KF901_22190 [Myxococcales bacterium]|nr:hypothetical protein [Myxococcales bacterium]
MEHDEPAVVAPGRDEALGGLAGGAEELEEERPVVIACWGTRREAGLQAPDGARVVAAVEADEAREAEDVGVAGVAREERRRGALGFFDAELVERALGGDERALVRGVERGGG